MDRPQHKSAQRRWRQSLTHLALVGTAVALAGCDTNSQAEAGASPADAGSSTAKVTQPDAYVFTVDEPRELITRDKAFRVTWRPNDGVVPINEHFSVDVTVTKNDETRTPVTGASVTMSCFMPEHGHGMLREPRSEEIGEGRYRVNGFLLHMDGYWTVSVNLLVDGLAASAEDELRL